MPAPHHSVFLQTRCPSCRQTTSTKALKAQALKAVALLAVGSGRECAFSHSEVDQPVGAADGGRLLFLSRNIGI